MRNLRAPSALGRVVALIALFWTTSCASTPPFIWAADLPAGKSDAALVQENDVVRIKLLAPHDYTAEEKVRPDGKIAPPLLGEVVARGKRISDLGNELRERLATAFKNPNPVVTLDRPELKVTVVGEVKNGGVYALAGPSVLHALGAAGGLSEYADSDRIFVVRRSFSSRVRFRYQDLRGADAKSILFDLQPGDVVVVE